MPRSFLRLLSRCYRMALPYGRLKLLAVLGLILLNGLVQLIGVTSVFPFFALATDPNRVQRSRFGSWVLHFFPPMTADQLLVVAGCFAIAMLVLASLGSLASEVLRVRYAYGFCHWLRQRLFDAYARQPYAFFLRRNVADLNQRLFDAQIFIQNVLLPVGEILARFFLVILMVGAIFLVQPWIALGAAVVFGGFYLLAFLWLRPHTRMIGDGFQSHNVGFWQYSNQFLQGIKTVLVHGKGRFFKEQALNHSIRLGQLQARLQIYSNGPRYLIEPISFGGLVAVVVLLAHQGRSFSDILPNLTVMAFAGYKLLPALQLLYGQLVTVAAHNYTLKHLEEELIDATENVPEGSAAEASAKPLPFHHEIRLDHIRFQYPGTHAPTLHDIDLVIGKNEALGIAGASGSGKSTLVDVILGLHLPQAGKLLVDGVPLSRENIAGWRELIGYVPQDIYLLDDTITVNIAFGVDPEKVDMAAVREAARGAQILEFIEQELPQGFETVVGERGARLSGGQRQRIGLARALYRHPQVLILDEATSALDHQTELAVMETVHRLQGALTIITIAHRLSTLERCDRVIRMDKGRVLANELQGR